MFNGRCFGIQAKLARAKYKPTTVKRASVFHPPRAGLARRSRDISKLPPQVLQHLQILVLSRLRRLRIASKAARHATAMKSQFAGNLVAAHSGAPRRKAARG